ncbi:MAG: VWA domain-containing protein [Cyanobacteria bacterium]|nr:VWA domain-containing protein [Cyanobacteriota bacterium]
MIRVFLISVIAVLALPLSAQQPTFRSSVRLVNVTVVAHDSSGRPVKDLAASDFRIFEDGKEQKVEVFSVDTGAAPFATPPAARASQIFSNRAPRRSAGGISVILFDRLNSTWEDQKFARDQIIRLVVKASAEDRIALYVLESERITVLHDFTSDTIRLTAVLNKYVGTTSVELLRSEEKLGDFAPTGMAGQDAETIAWLQRVQTLVSENYTRQRALLTTNALESIAHHLAGTPGRKSLIWVSGAFPLVIPGDHGPQIMSREVSRAARAINSADVAVYPVDIRGLMPALNPSTATATTVRGAPPAPVFNTISTVRSPQDTMDEIADATGGRAFLNTNDIGGAIRKAIEDSRVSYVLGYYSARPDSDQKFRRINVKVGRPGVDLRYRKGYVPPLPVVRNAKTRLDSLTRVMQSPVETSSIPLAAEISRIKNEGTVVVRIDPESLTWAPDKDGRAAAIDIVIAQSRPDGTYYKFKETTVNLTANAERYQQMIEDGLTVSSNTIQENAYRLHVVVSDVASQSVGSLIIPIGQ